MPIQQQWKNVLGFWFEDSSEEDWFKKNLDYDLKIKNKFLSLYQKACACELEVWRAHPMGALAEIIILDQFSRNIFRDSPQAFAADNLALSLAQRAIELGFDHKLKNIEKRFLYMPYMHSESKMIHEQAMVLFTNLGSDNVLKFEIAHKKIIDKFSRYPHRNKILGRESTPEELEFLTKEGSSF